MNLLNEFEKRAFLFNRAMRNSPQARRNEIKALVNFLEPQEGDIILDATAGNGYVAYELKKHVGNTGKIVCVDSSLTMCERARKDFGYIINPLEDLKVPIIPVDKCVSLAGFHHIGDVDNALRALMRTLKKGGSLLIADVCNGTPTQKFFDEVVAKYSITGHEARFLDANKLAQKMGECNLTCTDAVVIDTPWLFSSVTEMNYFVSDLFGLDVDVKTVNKKIKQYLKYSKIKNRILMNWQLMYVKGTVSRPD